MSLKTQTYAQFPNTVPACLSLTAARRVGRVLFAASALTFFFAVGPVCFGGESEAGEIDLMTLSLDQLLEVKVDKVYGASKYEQKVTQAPAAVSLVTRDEIQKQGYRTLADVLRSVNGVYVTDDRNYSYVGMRGFNRPGDYNSRVLLLVDGHRLNDNVYDQGLYGTEGFLDVDLIERVEVVRGPSSSIYGNNAFFGVVNVITRQGRSINGFETTGEAGNHDTFKGGFTYGKLFASGFELLLSGSAYDSRGERRVYFPEFDAPATNNGMAENSDGDRAYHFYGSLGYGDFTLSGGWSWRRKDIPTASYLTTFNDGGELTEDERAYVDLKGEHDLTDTVKFIGHVAYDASWYRGEYPYGSGLGRVLNFDEAQGNWLSADWQFNWLMAERHKLIVGGDIRESLAIDQRNADIAPFALYLDDQREARNFGVFTQAEIGLLTNLVLNAGGRFDHYSSFGDTLNPRVGLIYDPWPATTFKALYGEAFRAPNAYELNYSYPGQVKANPALQPETIRTYELVWEQSLPAKLRFSTAGYYYEVENLVSQIIDPGDGLLVFQNLDHARAYGVELALEGRYESGVVARLSYAAQHAEDAGTGLKLSNSPEHLAKLNVIAPVWREKVFAGIDFQYSSPVQTVLGNRSEDVFLVNVTLFSQPVGRNLEVSTSIYNLFDNRNGFSASTEHVQDTIPLPGRSFRFKLTYRF
jgi:outer membrane receptor for ferrienterochelin and colicins